MIKFMYNLFGESVFAAHAVKFYGVAQRFPNWAPRRPGAPPKHVKVAYYCNKNNGFLC